MIRVGNHTIYYSYDTDDRLTQELWTTTDASPSEVYAFAYAYDAAGNRTKARRNGVDTYYEYNAGNQLTKSGDDALFANATNYAYDLNGSPRKLIRQHEPDGTTYFRYNPAGLAERVVWKDASITRFYYDANLQRYAMDEHGTLTYFLWDGLDILQERAANGTVTAEHTNAETPIAGIGRLVESHRPAAGEANPWEVERAGTAFAAESAGLAGDWGRSAARRPVSVTVLAPAGKPPRGFEPRTYALRKHCSTTELRWRWAMGVAVVFIGLVAAWRNLPISGSWSLTWPGSWSAPARVRPGTASNYNGRRGSASRPRARRVGRRGSGP